MAQTGMLKSRSVPGLFSLGFGQPDLGGKHNKKVTLGVTGQHAGMVDFHTHNDKSGPTEKAMNMASLIVEHPSWRLQTHLTVDGPKEEKPVDSQPKNMKWPRLQPAWLKHDKHCLRFYAVFQEHVVERWDENSRTRNVVIQYYLEDGTLSITEPKVENSGLMQGQFLKPSHAPRADGNGNLGPGDFHIGEEFVLNGIHYHVTGCDRYTRWFFEENGWFLGEEESVMKDQWVKSYTHAKIAEKGGLPQSRSAVEAKQLVGYQLGQPPADLKLIQFLQNDRKVLRYKAFWDDPTLYGNRFYFTIHYFLADNTMEINEAHARNSGRDAYPVFAKRGPIHRDNKMTAYPGMLAPEPEPYQPQDLLVGNSINVWRRKIVIYDCDEFTRKFYHEFLGIDQAAAVVDVAEHPKTHQKLHPPPHNGIGSEEDSLMNCMAIAPKAAKKDLGRLMTLTGEILRFEARMVNGEPEDENRRFIIGYFPADDCVACWELPVRNSGHMAGKFAEKKRMKNPNTGKYFTLPELAIGKTVCICAQAMLIMRADEHTLRFLENHVEDFPDADPSYCVSLLVPLARCPEMRDEQGIDPDTMNALCAENGVEIVDHNIITLLRSFSVGADGGPPFVSGPKVLDFMQQMGYQV